MCGFPRIFCLQQAGKSSSSLLEEHKGTFVHAVEASSADKTAPDLSVASGAPLLADGSASKHDASDDQIMHNFFASVQYADQAE